MVNKPLIRPVGPPGELLTVQAPPSPETRRWTPRRKAEIVAAVRAGLLTFEQARVRYELDSEELISWQRGFQRGGTAGLRVTRVRGVRDL